MSSSPEEQQCVICKRSKGQSASLKMHRFPKNVTRCQKWVTTLNIPFLYKTPSRVLHSRFVVCSNHFEGNQYVGSLLRQNAVPVKNLGKHQRCSNGDRDDVPPDRDVTVLQNAESTMKNINVDPMRNLIDEDWPYLETIPGSYDANIEGTSEVRVGPSFSNYVVELPSNPPNIYLHDNGKDITELSSNLNNANNEKNSFDDTVSDDFNLDEMSDSEDYAMKVSTLECFISNPSVRFTSNEGNLSRTLKKKRSMFAKCLNASYFEKHLHWISQDKKQVTDTHNSLRSVTRQRRKIIGRKSSRQVLSHPNHEALKFIKHGTGCCGHWNTSGLSAMEMKAKAMKTEDKLCGIVFHFFNLADVTKTTIPKKRKSLSKTSDAVKKLEIPSTYHGLVIMVKGLYQKWKYIIMYDVFANTLQGADIEQMLKSCIKMLQDISYEVKFLVCNCDHFKFFNDQLRISYTKPYFTVAGEKIYFYFDPCNLLQHTLNVFIKTDVLVGKYVATWKYVQTFLQQDSEQNYKLAPNLSLLNDVPVFCEGLSTNENNMALEVFSSAVSTGLYMYATAGVLPEEAIHTSKFLHTLNKLMNCFLMSKPNYYKNVGKSKLNVSEHMDILLELKSILLTWKLASVESKGGKSSVTKKYQNKKRKCTSKDENVKEDGNKSSDMASKEIDSPSLIDDFIPQWLTNVSALEKMWKELEDKFGVKHFSTVNIRQNCSQYIMAAIKKRNKNYSGPNVTDFEITVQSLLHQSF